MNDKTKEGRLRRLASKYDLAIRKSRKRNWHPNNQGKYMVFHLRTHIAVFGYNYDATLDEVQRWLEA